MISASPRPVSASDLCFSRALVQDILAGALARPQDSRRGLVIGDRFSSGQLLWLADGDLASACREHPDALASLITHPTSPPVPTAEESALPRPASGLLLLASLNTKGVLEMRAFDASAPEASGLPITLF